MKILAVDDTLNNLEIIKLLLRTSGHPVVSGTNGAEAVELAWRERPDLIFMDLALPGDVDGLEATRRIKSLPGMGDVWVIAVTAMVTRGDHASALAAGCDDFIRKPYTRKDLLDAVKKCEAISRSSAAYGEPRSRMAPALAL
jgi:CheY-like chemotaxis protein